MSNVSFNLWFNEVLDDVPGVHQPVAFNAIRNAAIEFCERSWIYRTIDAFDVVAGQGAIEYAKPRYLSLPGILGNYASTPDSATVSITGNIDIRARARLANWVPGMPVPLVAKDDVGNRDFKLSVNSSGGLDFFYTSDGVTTAGRQADSTVLLAFAANSIWFVRVTYDTTTGTVTFYKSEDGSAWSQLGDPVVITSGDIHDGPQQLEVGSRAGGTLEMHPFDIFYAELRDGIDGTIVSKFDPARFAPGELTATMETGEEWTVHQSGHPAARIVLAGDSLVIDPYLLQQGKLDIGIIEDNGETCTIAVTYEGRLIDLERPRESRYTHEDQQRFFPGDKGFDQVEALQDRELTWGV